MEKTQPTQIFQLDFYHERASVPRRHLAGFEELFSNIARFIFLLFKDHGRILSSEHHVPLHKQSKYTERLLLIALSWDWKMLTRGHSCINLLKIWNLPELLCLYLFISIFQDLYFPHISIVVSDFCPVFIRSLLVYDLEHLETNFWTCQFQTLRLRQWCKKSGANWKFSCKSEIQNYKHIISPKRRFQHENLEAAILVC